MLGAFAQYYSDVPASTQLKDFGNEYSAAAQWGSSLGYRQDGKEITVEETEAQAVRESVQYVCSGQSKLQIWLSGLTPRFKTRAGKDFTLYWLGGFCINPFFKGKIVYEGISRWPTRKHWYRNAVEPSQDNWRSPEPQPHRQ